PRVILCIVYPATRNLLQGGNQVLGQPIGLCPTTSTMVAETDWLAQYLIPALQEIARAGIHDAQNDQVFGRTFAIEVLACVMEQDSLEDLLMPDTRKAMVEFTLQYLKDETDFRGYVSDESGWAHSVAHVADLTQALFKHNDIDSAWVSALLQGWQTFLKQSSLPFLMFDEDQRIASALKAAVKQGRLNALNLAVFFDELLDDEEDDWFHHAFRSRPALNRFKNIQNLIRSLYLQLQLDVRGEQPLDVLTVLKGLLRKLDAGFYPA
ncbi:MAG: DUF2785 domain-containing protein, partial [Reinekea sp.]|nr:DUF2785 domain-containing protein [Reinekea sp.]